MKEYIAKSPCRCWNCEKRIAVGEHIVVSGVFRWCIRCFYREDR